MASYTSCLITIIFLLIYLQSGASLRCYECKSKFNGDCDSIEEKTVQNEVCEYSKLVKAFPKAGSKFVCVKHRMAQKDEPGLSVVRGCAPDDYCSQFSNSKECITCDTDLCNSSSAVLPSIVLSIISFTIFMKYYF